MAQGREETHSPTAHNPAVTSSRSVIPPCHAGFSPGGGPEPLVARYSRANCRPGLSEPASTGEDPHRPGSTLDGASRPQLLGEIDQFVVVLTQQLADLDDGRGLQDGGGRMSWGREATGQ